MGEDVDERERVVRVLIGEERVRTCTEMAICKDSLGAVRLSLCAGGYNANPPQERTAYNKTRASFCEAMVILRRLCYSVQKNFTFLVSVKNDSFLNSR